MALDIEHPNINYDLIISGAMFEKDRKVSETPCCYLEVGPLSDFGPTCKKLGRKLKSWRIF